MSISSHLFLPSLALLQDFVDFKLLLPELYTCIPNYTTQTDRSLRNEESKAIPKLYTTICFIDPGELYYVSEAHIQTSTNTLDQIINYQIISDTIF